MWALMQTPRLLQIARWVVVAGSLAYLVHIFLPYQDQIVPAATIDERVEAKDLHPYSIRAAMYRGRYGGSHGGRCVGKLTRPSGRV